MLCQLIQRRNGRNVAVNVTLYTGKMTNLRLGHSSCVINIIKQKKCLPSTQHFIVSYIMWIHLSTRMSFSGHDIFQIST